MNPLHTLHWLTLGALLVSTAAIAQTKLVVGYTAVPDFAAAFIAKERGFFEKHKLDVTLQQLPLTSNVPPALVSDSIQIGGTTPPVFLQAVDSGLDLVAVTTGATYDNTKNYVGIVGKAGANIKTAQDLVGKKFGVPGLGGTLHVLVRRWLADKGVDSKRVTFIEVPLPQIPSVLQGGSIDAAVTAEPFVTRIVQTKIGEVVPGFSTDMPNGFATVSYVATRQWATSNGPALKAFRESIAEAVAFANSNREQAYADLGKYFKVPEPVLKATPWPALASTVTDAQMRFWSDTMATQDMLKKPVVLSSLLAK
jgi:NitT/TauT family transport system substrate-binding protein